MKRTNLAFVATAVALAASGGTLGVVPAVERQEPTDAAARTTPPEQRPLGGVPTCSVRVGWGKSGRDVSGGSARP